MTLCVAFTTTLALLILAALVLAAFGAFSLVSIRENQPRAARVALASALALGACLAALALAPEPARIAALGLIAAAVVVALSLFVWPAGRVTRGPDVPTVRVDERDTMFARAHLVPGSPEFEAYYARRPEHRASDDATRRKPGLLSPEARLADPLLFAAPAGSFFLTEALREAVDGPVSSTRLDRPPGEMTRFVKALARYFGALAVGVTRLQPYHVYSHVGRGTGRPGEPISVEHDFAVAFTVEMDAGMIAANPAATGVMESARQYVESTRVAVSLAAAIRDWGYPARAHIDGNYRVIAPLVARDAGLGEIGRMGLLMTPRLGPRVRLGVVTTDLPLVVDPDGRADPVLDFCTRCRKCAENCPSQAIPHDERRMIHGALRWRIDADACFRYWNTVGTDCGICMNVCPFSHPDHPLHNLVRWGIARSGFFRRAALRLDNVVYGRKPAPRTAPAWTRGGEGPRDNAGPRENDAPNPSSISG